MEKRVTFTDDLSITEPAVKMVCECGWVEKAFADREAVSRAATHIRTKHTNGSIVYRNYTIEKV